MQEDALQGHLEDWKTDLEVVWRAIPKAFRNDHAIRRTLQCHLYGRLHHLGYDVVADYFPPRVKDRPIDLIALREDRKIMYAVCFEQVISLAAVKSLMSFEVEIRTIFTTSPLEKKVRESRFFLKPEIQHCHLQPFGQVL